MFRRKEAATRAGKSRLLRMGALALAPALALLLVTTSSGPASASWRNGEMYNHHKAQCMDGGGGWLSAWDCNGSPVQIWTDISSSWTYQFRDGDGQCVDEGQSTGLFSCNGGNWQQWQATYIGTLSDGRSYYQFKNMQTGYCLDSGSNWNGLMSYPCNANDDYQWWSWN